MVAGQWPVSMIRGTCLAGQPCHLGEQRDIVRSLEMSVLNGSCHARDSCADNSGPTGQPGVPSRIIPYLL